MTNRTALLTAGSIVAVVLAALAALAVNMGIFDRASSSEVGQLTAADLEGTAGLAAGDGAASPELVEVAGDGAASPQLIEVAGIATVTASSTTIGTVDQLAIDGVDARPGWDWEIARPAPEAAEIRFTDGDQTQLVTLTSAEGRISARIRSGDPTATPASASTSTDDDLDDDGAHDDDDHEDEDEDEEHEGGEDDD